MEIHAIRLQVRNVIAVIIPKAIAPVQPSWERILCIRAGRCNVLNARIPIQDIPISEFINKNFNPIIILYYFSSLYSGHQCYKQITVESKMCFDAKTIGELL